MADKTISDILFKYENWFSKDSTRPFFVREDVVKAMQEFSQAQRLQARNLVFENNKPVADHVNETFEGLNSLTDDTEVVWWYKELIVQTVLHFTLQERQKVIQECIETVDRYWPPDSSLATLYRKMISGLETLKK